MDNFPNMSAKFHHLFTNSELWYWSSEGVCWLTETPDSWDTTLWLYFSSSISGLDQWSKVFITLHWQMPRDQNTRYEKDEEYYSSSDSFLYLSSLIGILFR
jgi:hypothetical protein